MTPVESRLVRANILQNYKKKIIKICIRNYYIYIYIYILPYHDRTRTLLFEFLPCPIPISYSYSVPYSYFIAENSFEKKKRKLETRSVWLSFHNEFCRIIFFKIYLVDGFWNSFSGNFSNKSWENIKKMTWKSQKSFSVKIK